MVKGGLIAWVRLDRRLTSEIYRRASIAASEDLWTSIFVPKLARDGKAGVDKMLLEFKSKNVDF